MYKASNTSIDLTDSLAAFALYKQSNIQTYIGGYLLYPILPAWTLFLNHYYPPNRGWMDLASITSFDI